MKSLLLVALLVLPHDATAASIPLVFTFDQLSVKTSPGVPVYQPITPIVMHVVLTFNDVPDGRVVSPSGATGTFGGVWFDGVTISQLPPPDDLGPGTSESLYNKTAEKRAIDGVGRVMQQTSANWQLDTFYPWRPLEDQWRSQWHSQMYIILASERREMFPNDMRPGVPTGIPTLRSALETLAWGGVVSMQYGWFSHVWRETSCGESATFENATPECVPESSIPEPAPQVNMSYLTGTYALDTTATAVPEPTTFVLLLAGLGAWRLRGGRFVK